MSVTMIDKFDFRLYQQRIFSIQKITLKNEETEIQIGRKIEFIWQMYVYYPKLIKKKFYFKMHNNFEQDLCMASMHIESVQHQVNGEMQLINTIMKKQQWNTTQYLLEQ